MISVKAYGRFSPNLRQWCAVRTEMNTSHFGVKRSKIKVTVE